MALPTATAKEQYDQRSLVVNADGSTTGTRVYRVEYPESFDAASDSDKSAVDGHVLTQTGVDRWDAYPGQPRCLAQTASVANGGSQRLWMATYTYSDKFDGNETAAAEVNGDGDGLDFAGEGAAGSSPAGADRGAEAEARPYTVRSIKRTTQEVLEFDATTGRRVVNTAGDPFDPPLMTERTHYGYEITWFRYPSNLRWATPVSTPPYGRPDYLDTVNDASFKVFGRSHAAGTLRVSDVSVSMQWDKGSGGALVPVCEIRVELLAKSGGWKRTILSQGVRAQVGGGKVRAVLDASGQPVTEPVPLDDGGYVLPAAQALVYVSASEYPSRNLIELFQ